MATPFIVFGDASWPVESLTKVLPGKKLWVWIEGRGWLSGPPERSPRQQIKGRATVDFQIGNAALAALAVEECREGLASLRNAPVAIVGFENAETSKRVIEALRGLSGNIRILEMGHQATPAEVERRVVAWGDLVSGALGEELSLLSMQEIVGRLKAALAPYHNIALLLQDDPDPDGLASALAVRKLIHKNSQKAQIVSFGKITRPENAAMARLLDIDLRENIKDTDLVLFDCVMLVDCQPNLFANKRVIIDAVLDHHPNRMSADDREGLRFVEIREEVGALSSLMTHLLRAAGEEPSQRLSTALLYGIKTDTLMLNRQVSRTDLESFLYLYPRINAGILRKIERPELPAGFVESLRLGLRYAKVSKGLVILPMGEVAKEEWISQGSDFVAQIEGAQVAICVGQFEGRVQLCLRSIGGEVHVGQLARSVFGEFGSAGGHRTMAKAILNKPRPGEKCLLPWTPSSKLVSQLRRLISPELKELSLPDSVSSA